MAKKKINLNTNTLLIVLLGVLVVMAGVQAMQLVTISSAIYSGAIASSHTGAQLSSSSGLNVQSQVGGCG